MSATLLAPPRVPLLLEEWGRFWELLGDLGAKYEPVPIILQALAALAGTAP